MKKIYLLSFLLSALIASAQIPASGKVEQFTFNNTLNGMISSNFGPYALVQQYDFDRFGNPNAAYSVAADSNCILNAPINGLPLGNSDRSVCLWIKNLGPVSQVHSYFNYSHENHSFGFTEETSPTNKVMTNYTTAVTTTTLADNQWHCLIGTHTASTNIFYVDGVMAGTHSFAIYTDTNSVRIGHSPAWHQGVGVSYPGFLIDELIIYNRVLSPTEVTQICSAASTSIEEMVATSLPVTIFPNPSNNLINIESEVNCTAYEISDLSGKVLVSENLSGQKTIRTDLPQGIYLLKLMAGANSTVKKIVVQ